MADDRALIAHLLRRTSFGPFPGQIDARISAGYTAALEAVLDAAPAPVDLPRLGRGNDDYERLVRWWLDRMRDPASGLHEKMVWFWHGHFTTSLDSVDPADALRQHAMFRTHALGNFRALTQAITVDPAMLRYLNGAGSTGDAPNENYGRELMELFTLGRGNYTEADVRAAARGLAGWDVDDDGEAQFDETNAYRGVLTFLGRTGALYAADVIDTVCDQPACASFVAAKLHRFFVGVQPSDDRLAELATTFRESGLEIRPLVENILRHASFAGARMARPRTPVEWFIAATAGLGVTGDAGDLEPMGQVPFYPPSVAGWPEGNRWLAAGSVLARAAAAGDMADDTEVSDTADLVTHVLERLSLYEVSAATRGALDRLASRVESHRDRASALYLTAVLSPEFALA
jgi:uncharacterized protein (DUF1800 family)